MISKLISKFLSAWFHSLPKTAFNQRLLWTLMLLWELTEHQTNSAESYMTTIANGKYEIKIRIQLDHNGRIFVLRCTSQPWQWVQTLAASWLGRGCIPLQIGKKPGCEWHKEHSSASLTQDNKALGLHEDHRAHLLQVTHTNCYTWQNKQKVLLLFVCFPCKI